jgi:hypothetical protein
MVRPIFLSFRVICLYVELDGLVSGGTAIIVIGKKKVRDLF